MRLTKSRAFKLFKNEIGQANHMLITTLIGLDGIVPYGVEKLPEFNVSWNPNDKKQSIDRSKLFVKKSSLSWLVDNIDMYFRIINQSPTIISDEEFKNVIDSPDVSRSVYKRLNKICEYCDITTYEFALVDLLICWRNRMVHFQAENDIQLVNQNLLIDNAEEINNKYKHLDIKKTLEAFNSNRTPTFKEIASFVKAAIELVFQIDKKLLVELNMVDYADKIIVNHIKENEATRLNDIFSKTNDVTLKKLIQILFNNGFSNEEPNENVLIFCNQVSQWNYDEARKHFERKTFLKENN